MSAASNRESVEDIWFDAISPFDVMSQKYSPSGERCTLPPFFRPEGSLKVVIKIESFTSNECSSARLRAARMINSRPHNTRVIGRNFILNPMVCSLLCFGVRLVEAGATNLRLKSLRTGVSMPVAKIVGRLVHIGRFDS